MPATQSRSLRLAAARAHEGSIAYHAFAIAPSDVTDLTEVPDGLTCTADGTASVITESGETVTIALVAGSIFPLRVTRVRATGTTATGIVGLV